MRFPLRLYRMHDLELIWLSSASDISFRKTVLQILRSYTKGDFYHIDVLGHIKEIDPSELPYVKLIYLDLNENDEKDAPIIKMLSATKDGYKNGLIRSILKMYFLPFSHSFYFIDPTSFTISSDNVNNTMRTVQPYIKWAERKQKKKKENKQNLTVKNSDKNTENIHTIIDKNETSVSENISLNNTSYTNKDTRTKDKLQNNDPKQQIAEFSALTDTSVELDTDAQDGFDFFSNLIK